MNDNLASAVFDTHAEGDRAIADLRSAGVADAALSVVTQRGDVTSTADADGSVIDEHHGSALRVDSY